MKHLFLLLASLFYVGVAHGQARTPANYTAATVAFGSVTGSYTQFLAGGKALVHLEIPTGFLYQQRFASRLGLDRQISTSRRLRSVNMLEWLLPLAT
jgi:hypothetical protein